jgi:hypothetical protein
MAKRRNRNGIKIALFLAPAALLFAALSPRARSKDDADPAREPWPT